jgi:hypothetical protein
MSNSNQIALPSLLGEGSALPAEAPRVGGGEVIRQTWRLGVSSIALVFVKGVHAEKRFERHAPGYCVPGIEAGGWRAGRHVFLLTAD